MLGVFIACDDSIGGLVNMQINEPVIMSKQEFRNSVKVTTRGQKIEQCGKLCFYNGYLFISEPGKGIHVIDNRKPSAPQNIAFIELAGNADIGVRNDLLYADALIDLVWFDISNPAKPELKGRLEDVFPENYPICGNEYPVDYSQVYDENGNSKGMVVGWELKRRRMTAAQAEQYNYYANGKFVEPDMAYYTAAGSTNKSSSGVNGSMSRFALYDKYLYAVVNGGLSIFDVSSDKPSLAGQSADGLFYEVETVFAYKEFLFFGMPSGMSIYSVKDPLTPEYCSWILHIYGCDPVVVDNDLAYVTVRSGNFCGQSIDELMVIGVKDVYKPELIVSYKMSNPKGLGIDNGTLFLCDDGLKVFKIGDDPQTLVSNQITHIKGMDGYDLIPYDNVLMMIADDGLYQYDYTNISNIKPLSQIKIYGSE